MTTKALTKIVKQAPKQSAIEAVLAIGRDPSLAIEAANPRALLEAYQRELKVKATPKQIDNAIEALVAGKKWGGEDLIPNRPAFLLAMFKALQRNKFCSFVITEAMDRLIDSPPEWLPTPSTVIAACQEAAEEAALGARLLKRECDAIETAEREFRKKMDTEMLKVEDEMDPTAERRRYEIERLRRRPIERRQRIKEAMEAIPEIEATLEYIARGGYSKYPSAAVSRYRRDQELKLAQAKALLVDAEAFVAEAEAELAAFEVQQQAELVTTEALLAEALPIEDLPL